MTEALKKMETIQLTEILYSSQEECIKNSPGQLVFEIKKREQIPMGYVGITLLREYLQVTPATEAENLVVRNSQSTHWISIFEHPSFQRRKPQLVPFDSIQIDDDKEYYILSQGQKHGPYEKIQLQAMLERNEILLTDMVSPNAGHTWMKVFQLDGFERRALKDSQELPEMPIDVIEEGNENIIAISPSTEAITNLAYLSNVKKNNTAKKITESIQTKFSETVGSSSIISKALLVLSLLGIAYFAYNIKDQLKSPFKDDSQTIGEHRDNANLIETLTPVESFDSANSNSRPTESKRPSSVNNQGRFETKKLQPIRPAGKSFMETRTYRNAQDQDTNSPAASSDDNYYENEGTIELDPVRSQVTKETYNDTTQEEDVIPSIDSLYEEESSN